MRAVVLALLRRGDRWFLQRRDPAGVVMPGLWEFPGGKVEAGEVPTAALARELREEIGLEPAGANPWPTLEGEPCLLPFVVAWEGEPRTSLAWGWFTAEEMLRLPHPPRNAELVDRLRKADLIGSKIPGPEMP